MPFNGLPLKTDMFSAEGVGLGKLVIRLEPPWLRLKITQEVPSGWMRVITRSDTFGCAMFTSNATPVITPLALIGSVCVMPIGLLLVIFWSIEAEPVTWLGTLPV